MTARTFYIAAAMMLAATAIAVAILREQTPERRAAKAAARERWRQAEDGQRLLAKTPDPWLDKDWHPAGEGVEVRWINDDAFSHVGGHCYARKTDGSTRASNGAPGMAQIGEKYCIAARAKDTPFEIPDKR